MGNLTEKYFILEETDLNGIYPSIKLKRNPSAIKLGRTAPTKECDDFEFELKDAHYRTTAFADHHYYRYLLLSEPIAKAMESMNLYNIDYLDAEISNSKGRTNDDYKVIHIRNPVKSLNKERSKWKPPAFDPNRVMIIDYMVLDYDVLLETPWNNGFCLREKNVRGMSCFTNP